MRSYKLHLIRHGETQGNREGRYVGRTDLPVTPEGVAQLEALLERYEYPSVQQLYTSPLLRCRQTAAILYPEQSAEIVEELQELDFGEFEGKGIEELKGDERFLHWLKHSHEGPPDGERGDAFAARLTAGLNRIFASMMRDGCTNAALITHGGVIMTLLSLYGLPEGEMGRWVTENGMGYTLLLSPQLWMQHNRFEIYGLVPDALERVEEEENPDDPDWLWSDGEEGEGE